MNGLSLLNLKTDSSEFVEVDTTGRYGRYNEVLGKGASKTVYKAFDEYKGIEVAWNQVKLNDFLQSPQDLERLYSEIHLLKTLNHQNIMKFHTSWVDISNRNINFVTEMFTSGTLKQYREKHKRVNIRAVKHWCRQILEGLLYLHGHDPPVIHRDLKCDNIFINGHQGEVKIGDLGLAAILWKPHAAHCVGTPEFMAPEVYAEEYNELVDIYSFGMCVLEMVTFEYPYSECTHPAQIYKKVTSGKKPDALYKVKDPEVRRFVEKCLATVSLRLSAWELLNDPFLQIDDLRSIDFHREIDDMHSLLRQPYPRLNYQEKSMDHFCNGVSIEDKNGWDNQSFDIEQSGMELFECNDEERDKEHSDKVDLSIKGKRRDDGDIFLRLRIADKEGRIRNIYFPFDIETDTALSVATEMVSELNITDQDVTKIADMIDGEIASLVPGWNHLLGIEEINEDSANISLCQNCVSNHSSTGSLVNFMLKNRGTNNLEILQCCGNGCAATRGRFEEITYHVDGLENHGLKSVKNLNLSRESNKVDPYIDVLWDQYASLECSSEEGNYEEEHEKLDNTEIKIDHKVESCGENTIEFLSCAGSFTTNGSSSCDHSDNDDREIEQELRWVRAKYHMELEKVRDRQLGILPKCLKKDDFNSNIYCGVSEFSSSKILHEEKSKKLVTVKSFCTSSSVPNHHHRTTSLPIDAVLL